MYEVCVGEGSCNVYLCVYVCGLSRWWWPIAYAEADPLFGVSDCCCSLIAAALERSSMAPSVLAGGCLGGGGGAAPTLSVPCGLAGGQLVGAASAFSVLAGGLLEVVRGVLGAGL